MVTRFNLTGDLYVVIRWIPSHSEGCKSVTSKTQSTKTIVTRTLHS